MRATPPNPNFAFAEWTEDGLQVSTNASYNFTVVSNRNLVANFTDIYPPPLAVGGTFYQLIGQPLVINIADLIYNNYDADGDPVMLFSVSGSIYIWDDFTDLGSEPQQAFYRRLFP